MKRLVSLAVAVTLAACAGNPAPVHVIGREADITALAGEWLGEYRSEETGRTGSISFKLQAGKDTAYGDVLMIPRESHYAQEAKPADATRNAPRILTIAFVRVSGQLVSGTIEPYQSPDCGCQLSTVFRGELRGDRIEGDFLTRHSEHDTAPQRGKWWATRRETGDGRRETGGR